MVHDFASSNFPVLSYRQTSKTYPGLYSII
jgi:hypothetical protein